MSCSKVTEHHLFRPTSKRAGFALHDPARPQNRYALDTQIRQVSGQSVDKGQTIRKVMGRVGRKQKKVLAKKNQGEKIFEQLLAT